MDLRVKSCFSEKPHSKLKDREIVNERLMS